MNSTQTQWKPEDWQALEALIPRYKAPGGTSVDWKKMEAENPPEWQMLRATRQIKTIRSAYMYKYRKQFWSPPKKAKYVKKAERVKASNGVEMARPAPIRAVAARSVKFCPDCGCNLAVFNAALSLT